MHRAHVVVLAVPSPHRADFAEIRMINELGTASNLLDIAVERYLNACSALENYSISQEISDRITKEIVQVHSYETKIQQAKLAISRVRNRTPAIVPINSLPLEILARIFRLVCGKSFCAESVDFEDLTESRLPKYPDLLMSVCSRWRHILTCSREIWSHIDLVPHYIFNREFSRKAVDRAEVHAARAGQLPLEIHIRDLDPRAPEQTAADQELLDFLASVASRMTSLDLVIVEYGFTVFHSRVIQTCLAGSTPGTLTRLRISDKSFNLSRSQGFIETAINPSYPQSLLLDLPQQLLEDHLRAVTVLQLHGPCPYWTSSAYHGLVELHLAPWAVSTPAMTESQLIGILAASPKLRVLHLNISITGAAPLDSEASIVPMRLGYLEILNVTRMDPYTLATLLRLLAPASDFLQLAIYLASRSIFLSPGLKSEINKFLARSPVGRLHVHDPEASVSLTKLLDLCPHLRDLALEGLIHKPNLRAISHRGGAETLTTHPPILNLFLLRSSINFNELLCIAEKFPIRTLTIWRSSIIVNFNWVSRAQELRDLLSGICLVVNVLRDDEPNPVGDWELLNS